MRKGSPGRWPLVLIAAPAAVAIWSGWVGLGGLAGFGPVNLLPGIGGGLTLNTAITLPVGVEAYGAYALGAWMAPGTPGRARRFARWSALGALIYGLLGQVAYHLLASHGYTVAPVPVVVLVSCMPVIVLGFAAALTHLLRAPGDVAGEASSTHAGAGSSPATRPVSVSVSLPGVREIQRRQQCHPKTAQKIRKELERLARGYRLVPAGALEVSTLDPPAGPGGTAPAGAVRPAGVSPGSPPAPAGSNGQAPHG